MKEVTAHQPSFPPLPAVGGEWCAPGAAPVTSPLPSGIASGIARSLALGGYQPGGCGAQDPLSEWEEPDPDDGCLGPDDPGVGPWALEFYD